MNWPLLGFCFSFSLGGHFALATDALYQNNSPSSYYFPGNPPPAVDAKAFDNESEFDVSYTVYTANVVSYETLNTLFYTNNGVMTASSPASTNGFIFSQGSLGCGYNFDLQTTNANNSHLLADTFYNPGTVRCNSTIDGNNTFTILAVIAGQSLFFQTSVGKFAVAATNIINPGTVEIGQNGLMQFTGQNADFSRSTLLIEGQSQNFSASGFFGTDTNLDWDPGADLTAATALSSLSAGNLLFLTNSTSFFNIQQNGTNGRLVRAVFLMDTSANVVTNVYITSNNNNFGNGTAYVEWIGSYLNPATGETVSNYLYLNDDYVLGASTNVSLTGGNGTANNGLPDNFSFYTSSSRLALGTNTPGGFQNVFVSGAITNPYSYFTAQLIASSVSTNKSGSNINGALTNLPGRIQITANKDLNLTLAQISGQNYLSLVATNQFDGSAGAQIDSIYSDLNLGVTNGFMNVSNLLASEIPNWSGSMQAWSTRWLAVDASGITNDYRVLLVKSQLSPTTPPQVQNLRLHATNSLTISDVLNIFGSVYMDAQSLTLTTNLLGNGATSFDGELNWQSVVNLGSSQLPNLLWLTNNGAIRALSLITLGSSATSLGAFINNGLFADQGSTIYAGNFLSSGIISNGIGNFLLQSQATTITNGSLTGGGDISITTGSLLTSNLLLKAGRSLVLQVTNLLTDTGTTNGNFWSVGGVNSAGVGLSLPVKPAFGDLLGTTITNVAWTNKLINDTWAGLDRGYSNSGYTNNAAIGQLVLDTLGSTATIKFSGTGASNAIYVDSLVLLDQAINRDNNGNLIALTFNTNLVIYYAQAMANGISYARVLNHKNNNHLRWLPSYAGAFSSTNLVYPAGVTNTVNAALAQDQTIDSDGDGTPNGSDPTPFFVPAEINFTLTKTNVPPLKAQLQWQSPPAATNYVLYKTNLLSANWLVFTNFISATNVPPLNGWPLTNTIFDTFTQVPQKYFRVLLNPNTVNLYGP